MESVKFGLGGYRNRNASRVGPVEDLLIFFCNFFFPKRDFLFFYFLKDVLKIKIN